MEEHQYLFFTIKHGSECCHVYATLEEFLAKIPISYCHPAPAREIIEECDFGESTYIVGPWYSEREGNDFQLAVTGKPNAYESIIQGITRELGEEIGATPKGKKDLRCKRVSEEWTGWMCNMKSGMTLNTLPVPEAPPEQPDHRRVLCVVHTTEDQVLEICQTAGTHLWPSPDDIDGIVAVPIEAARRIVKMKAANAQLSEAQLSRGSCMTKTLCAVPKEPTEELKCQEVLLCDTTPPGVASKQKWTGAPASSLLGPPSGTAMSNQTTGAWGGKPPTAVMGGAWGGKPSAAVMGGAWGGKPSSAVMGGAWGDKPSSAVMGGQATDASDESGGGEWTVVPQKEKKKKKKKK